MEGSGWAMVLWSVTQPELKENTLLVPQAQPLPPHTSSCFSPTVEPALFTGVKDASLGRSVRLNTTLGSCPQAYSPMILQEQEGVIREDRGTESQQAVKNTGSSSDELRHGMHLDLLFTDPPPGVWHLTLCSGMSCDSCCSSSALLATS